MLFNNVLVPIDGSDCSQLAIDYSMWLSSTLGSRLTGMHVIDPRLADLFISPGFAESLGFATDGETINRVSTALSSIGNRILDLFAMQAGENDVRKMLVKGWIVPEILRASFTHDLIVMGHHGSQSGTPIADVALGSVAERIAGGATIPVLVCINSLKDIRNIVVAFDGSEPSRGALLLGLELASCTKKPLLSVTAIMSDAHLVESRFIVEQGQTLLKEHSDSCTFEVLQGPATETILDFIAAEQALLIVGAYGFRDPQENILGRTTASLIRKSRNSLLIYR